MKIAKFLKTPAGNVAVFFGFVAAGGLLLYRSNLRAKAQAEQMTGVETVETVTPMASFTREAAPLKIPAVGSPSATSANSGLSATPKKLHGQAKPLPISIFSSGKSAESAADLSKVYAPYGRMIPCQTVITLESSRLDTPVIGLVTEDVWNNGRLVIPAGAEVHGRAQLDRSRERIAASGKWVIVWRDGTALNGTELILNGIALDREKDDTTGEFGLRDGSAGLVGDLIRTDNTEEIKLFASNFLAGLASGLQEVQTQNTAFGVTQVVSGSARNGALQGTADVLNAYAKQIQDAIERDGFFVRVPAGKQFYLYVTQTIDQAQGTRGNRKDEDIWKHEN